MTFIIDHHRLREIAIVPLKSTTEFDLCRGGRVFFVGGTLPIYTTLETMFESYCAEATDIFVLTFGTADTTAHGLEMAKLIKKNFTIRLLARLNHAVPDWLYQQIYAAGVDLIDITATLPGGSCDLPLDDRHRARYLAAQKAFPAWSVASTLSLAGTPGPALIRTIDGLLQIGIVPLPRLDGNGAHQSEPELCEVLHHMAAAWHTYGVPIKPFQALIGLGSPLVPAVKPGALRGIIDRLHDRRKLAASDLLRHLRVSAPADSLDSAGL
ncbi:MAG: hypothetical protein M0T70_09310 [Geobacteraceae bacterium]|nr:hypothetical protein [Geobacteraceae bacterium]